MKPFTAAVVQLTTTEDQERSLASAEDLVADAAGHGASLVALPENVSFMGPETQKQRLAESEGGPTFERLSRCAAQHHVWLLGGTLPERGQVPNKAYNTLTVFAPDGRLAAKYRKIHLFDIALGEGATHQESTSVLPGESAVLVHTPLAKIGLSVCYDVRFAALYRALRRAGAEILAVPAAFTVPTGRDHWEVLLRARAIENQCYVLAPAQVGANTETRRTFGRAMIIDPWGTLLAICPDRPSYALAEIDLGHVADLRRRMPCLDHERPVAYERVIEAKMDSRSD
ncbi:MAG: carbon-nitrogen hydrolase family protein [Deltaproteobacteria bacterium]|nr:carbon-nitrogen hydrolase family protein [Deltaproteobacteria bacterium]